jgi:hypothetical protein
MTASEKRRLDIAQAVVNLICLLLPAISVVGLILWMLFHA